LGNRAVAREGAERKGVNSIRFTVQGCPSSECEKKNS